MVSVVFHSFSLGDVDDVDIYVAQPIYEWQQTEKGKWVMEHAHDLAYHTNADTNTWGHRITITGQLPAKLATLYYLTYGVVH